MPQLAIYLIRSGRNFLLVSDSTKYIKQGRGGSSTTTTSIHSGVTEGEGAEPNGSSRAWGSLACSLLFFLKPHRVIDDRHQHLCHVTSVDGLDQVVSVVDLGRQERQDTKAERYVLTTITVRWDAKNI